MAFLFGAHGKKVDVCPVANGGTGAKNKSTAQQNLGTESRKLLWTNPNPTTKITTATTIALENNWLTTYDAVEIEWALFVEDKATRIDRFSLGSPTSTNPLEWVLSHTKPNIVSGGNYQSITTYQRTLNNATSSGIRINLCSYVDVLSMDSAMSMSKTENYGQGCIPIKIYGIKYNL